MTQPQEIKLAIRSKLSCPHCWETCRPEDLRWVTTHPDLLGDPKLGDEAQARFTPTRFDPEGNALDVNDSPCRELACPACHLTIPRASLELNPLIVSIAGAPASGKSYFLAAATWSMRQHLPGWFGLSLGEADPAANVVLNGYEEQQFLNPDRDAIVRLAKTEEQGDLYSTVRLEDRVVAFPRPFLFSLKPTRPDDQPDLAKRSRLLCLYDNAGESFQPGKDTIDNRVTGHLWRADAILYLYDPTQDVRFRNAVERVAQRPMGDPAVAARQETVLHEITERLNRRRAASERDRRRPLIVVLTKYDQWWPLLGKQRLPEPVGPAPRGGGRSLDAATVKHVSDRCRDLVSRLSPELVASAEGFSEDVWFVPVSATGCGPETDPETGVTGFRPRNLQPMWEAVPFYILLARLGQGLLPVAKAKRRVGDKRSQIA